jgi:signal transduction histidine kinase
MMTAKDGYQLACLPVMGHGRAIACIALTFDDAPPLDDAARDFLRLATRYAGQALERLRLLDAERDSRARAELLYGLAREVIVAERVDQVFDAALRAIAQGLGTPRAAILTYGADAEMKFRAWRGLSDGYRATVEGHAPWPRDAIDPAPVIVADAAADPALASYRSLFEIEQIGALAFFPLVTGRRLVGKFMVYYAEPYAPVAEELDLARAIADHVAAAVVRFEAFEELRGTVRFHEMFSGMLGHDLRNPLGAIVTAAQLAIARSPGDRITKPLSRVLTSSARMTRMIEQLLDFTHVRVGGGIPLVAQPVDLVPILRQVIEELEDANPEWTLTLECVGGAAGAWDADRLAQVFSNLIANAVQHGDVAGGVRIRVDGTHAGRVRIEIENTGTIPEELRPTIFEPMSGSQRRRDGSRGLGLGLYVSREIVRAHQGTITARSGHDSTTFAIELPR